jgi:hypothetical protein
MREMDKDASQYLAERFRRFAAVEARDRSPLYETLALGVAADPFALAFLATLPEQKRQPNLLFAALRHIADTSRLAILWHYAARACR